ncbi:DMT family transporter [Gorillibacterium sp. sgz5001074]|uniref:DMT family transporter n=1 Tax=Gorillibacterium sp. sgz5001074 TaxID=3446695 RepID=UPI003F665E27
MNATRAPLPKWALTLLLLAGIAAISFSSIFIRWSSAPSSILAMYRLVLTVLLMLPFLLRQRPDLRTVTLRDWLMMGASGVFLMLHFLLWMESLRYTSVASSTILLSLEPMFVLAGAYWLFRERTTARAVLGMSAAIAGAGLIGWGDVGISARALQGDLLSFLGTAAVAVHMLIGQSLARRIPTLLYSITVFSVAAAAFFLYNLLTSTPMTGYGARDWGIFLLLAVVPTVFGHVLFNWLLQYVNAATVSMSVLGEPVGATLLAYLLLGEKLNPMQAAAGLIIIWGVWFFLRHNRVHYEQRESGTPSTAA